MMMMMLMCRLVHPNTCIGSSATLTVYQLN